MYRVKKLANNWNGEGNATTTHAIVVVDSIATKEDALILAEVACLEHAERIGVTYNDWSKNAHGLCGFSFITNNGTPVCYAVERIS